MVLTAGIVVATWVLAQSTAVQDRHGDAAQGALRVVTTPSSRGQCTQCHPFHGDPDAPDPNVLFRRNDNGLCFAAGGASPCHQARPASYPLGENDRLPPGTADAGYFEANSGGTRRPGVDWRGRWPGESAWRDASTAPGGAYVSPHAHDPDMPRRDPAGEGACLNCHDPHGTTHHDLLTERWGGISGHGEIGAPAAYRQCLRCHGAEGPPGMDVADRTIEDWYDSGLNGERAGHQIRRNSHVAISWPAHVQVGDKLPCYDCHGAHGSLGYDGVRPNGHLISDQRPEWSGLDNTLKDAAQGRRFCLGCHIPSDGTPGSQTVEGIVMNTIPDETPEHRSTGTRNCNDCHGNDYSGPTAHNVHNPSEGESGNPGGGWGP
jgi:predicted CXXCH cytochrome family protein